MNKITKETSNKNWLYIIYITISTSISITFYFYPFPDKYKWLCLIFILFNFVILIFGKTISIFVLLKFYSLDGKRKSTNNYTYIDVGESVNEINGSKSNNIIIKCRYNTISVEMNSDESASDSVIKFSTTLSLIKRKFYYHYSNTHNNDETKNHSGSAVLDLKNRKIIYSNEYPRLSKGEILIFDKLK